MRVMENVTEIRGEARATTGPLYRSPVPPRTIEAPIARSIANGPLQPIRHSSGPTNAPTPYASKDSHYRFHCDKPL